MSDVDGLIRRLAEENKVVGGVGGSFNAGGGKSDDEIKGIVSKVLNDLQNENSAAGAGRGAGYQRAEYKGTAAGAEPLPYGTGQNDIGDVVKRVVNNVRNQSYPAENQITDKRDYKNTGEKNVKVTNYVNQVKNQANQTNQQKNHINQANQTAKDLYPLAKNYSDKLVSKTGKKFNEVTYEALVDGGLGLEDLKTDKSTLLMQAQIAQGAGKLEFAQNLRRAAEMVDIPDDEILEIYNMLRPNRTSKQALLQKAEEIRRKYGAVNTAGLIEEAAGIYGKRKIAE